MRIIALDLLSLSLSLPPSLSPSLPLSLSAILLTLLFLPRSSLSLLFPLASKGLFRLLKREREREERGRESTLPLSPFCLPSSVSFSFSLIFPPPSSLLPSLLSAALPMVPNLPTKKSTEGIDFLHNLIKITARGKFYNHKIS